jgi:hypothetical protein
MKVGSSVKNTRRVGGSIRTSVEFPSTKKAVEQIELLGIQTTKSRMQASTALGMTQVGRGE